MMPQVELSNRPPISKTQKIQKQIEEVFLRDSREVYSLASKLEKMGERIFPQDRCSIFHLLKERQAYKSLEEKIPKEFLKNNVIIPLYTLDFDRGCKYRDLGLEDFFDVLLEQIKNYKLFAEEVRKKHPSFADSLETADNYGNAEMCCVNEKDLESFRKFLTYKKIKIKNEIREYKKKRVFVNEKGKPYDLQRDGRRPFEDWITTGEILVDISPNPFVNSLSKAFRKVNAVYYDFLVQTIADSGTKSFGLMKKLFLEYPKKRMENFQEENLIELQNIAINGLIKLLKRNAQIYSSTENRRTQKGIIKKISKYTNWVDTLELPNNDASIRAFDVLQEIGIQCKEVLKSYRVQSENKKEKIKAMQTLGEMAFYLEGIHKEVSGISNKIDLSRNEMKDGFKMVKGGLESIDTTLNQGFTQVNKGLESNRKEMADVKNAVVDISESLENFLFEMARD